MRGKSARKSIIFVLAIVLFLLVLIRIFWDNQRPDIHIFESNSNIGSFESCRIAEASVEIGKPANSEKFSNCVMRFSVLKDSPDEKLNVWIRKSGDSKKYKPEKTNPIEISVESVEYEFDLGGVETLDKFVDVFASDGGIISQVCPIRVRLRLSELNYPDTKLVLDVNSKVQALNANPTMVLLAVQIEGVYDKAEGVEWSINGNQLGERGTQLGFYAPTAGNYTVVAKVMTPKGEVSAESEFEILPYPLDVNAITLDGAAFSGNLYDRNVALTIRGVLKLAGSSTSIEVAELISENATIESSFSGPVPNGASHPKAASGAHGGGDGAPGGPGASGADGGDGGKGNTPEGVSITANRFSGQLTVASFGQVGGAGGNGGIGGDGGPGGRGHPASDAAIGCKRSGGDGGKGGDSGSGGKAGNGGPGGNGGSIEVSFAKVSSGSVLSVSSKGGDGGPAGSPGQPGVPGSGGGGAGGSVYCGGGRDGVPGQQGQVGANGLAGSDGTPGLIVVDLPSQGKFEITSGSFARTFQ